MQASKKVWYRFSMIVILITDDYLFVFEANYLHTRARACTHKNELRCISEEFCVLVFN